jgi:AcrR family transcriptional regulator
VPRLLDPDLRTHQVVAAINHLIVDRGVDALSMREIGRVARLSPSSLFHHYGSREHLLRVAADQTGRARLVLMRTRLSVEGARAMLPADDEDVLTARAWLGWCELWRSHHWMAAMVERVREEELGLLAQHYDYRLSRDDLDLLTALIDGLLVAICRPERPMPRAAAHRILGREMVRLAHGHTDDSADPNSASPPAAPGRSPAPGRPRPAGGPP